MRYRCLLPIVVAILPTSARAEDPDEVLAKNLMSVVRDRLAPTPHRVEASTTLGKLGPRASSAVPELLTTLKRLNSDDTIRLQESIVRTLGQIGASTRPHLAELHRFYGRDFDLDLAIKRTTAQVLASGDEDVAVLVVLLRAKEDGQRLRATKSLAKMGTLAKAALPDLTATLADPDGDVRRGALNAIRSIQGGIAPADAVGVYLLDLQSTDEDVRMLAVKNIGRLGRDAAAAIKPLQALLADPNPEVRRATNEAINRIAASGQ